MRHTVMLMLKRRNSAHNHAPAISVWISRAIGKVKMESGGRRARKLVGGRPPVRRLCVCFARTHAANDCMPAVVKSLGLHAQDEEWTLEASERPSKLRKGARAAARGVQAEGRATHRKVSSAQKREKGEMSDDEERISHPGLAAMFAAWERTAVDFCAQQEASAASPALRRDAARRAESVCDALLAPLHLHLANLSRALRERERLKDSLSQLSSAKKAARAELMLAEQELFRIRQLAEQERQDFVAAESERRHLENAHELVSDIEGLLRHSSVQNPSDKEARAGAGGSEGGMRGLSDLTTVQGAGAGGFCEGGNDPQGEAELHVSGRGSGGADTSLANIEAALRAAVAACEVPAFLQACNDRLGASVTARLHGRAPTAGASTPASEGTSSARG